MGFVDAIRNQLYSALLIRRRPRTTPCKQLQPPTKQNKAPWGNVLKIKSSNIQRLTSLYFIHERFKRLCTLLIIWIRKVY
jgi:hypothetical protein